MVKLTAKMLVIPTPLIGYHGTSKDAALTILAEGFKVSANDYDWLGDGVYFFQDARLRAWEWAWKLYHEEAAVIGAKIDFSDCMDLLDIGWAHFLAKAYDGFLGKLKETGLQIPRQTRGAHRLDREVINYAVAILSESGRIIRSVRAAFSEGAPVFSDSALFDRAHVQIAVRDPKLILEYWMESEPKHEYVSRT